jgi:hypothetical protein
MLVVRAIHTFTAEHGDELEFKAGENIEVIEKDEAFGDGWWRVSFSFSSITSHLTRETLSTES